MYTPWWKRFDWILAGASLLLFAIGLAMLASSTLGTDEPYFTNELIIGVFALVAAGTVLVMGYQWLLRWAPIWYGLTAFLLVLVVGFGRITHGASSWLTLGPFTLQPSELAKLTLVLMMAWLIAKAWQDHWSSWRLFGFMAGLTLPLLALVILQPDMGTASVLAVGWLVCIWLSPVDKRVLLALVGMTAAIVLIAWLLLAPYQKARLTTFLNPGASPLGAGYNVLQSQIAVGSGQWLGQGWGRGTQSHLNFLPEHHTDFIFASLSEEFGFAGALLVVVLYGLVVWRGVRIAWRSTDRPTVVIACALTLIIIWQAVINMAMNVGLAPVTGIPLPLVSYGGSSLLTTLLCLAVLESIALSQKAE